MKFYKGTKPQSENKTIKREIHISDEDRFLTVEQLAAKILEREKDAIGLELNGLYRILYKENRPL